MTSFTGKFASVRGSALLLTLLLGAGFLVAACGEEEVPAPTTPAPPPPPPAPTPTPTPTPEPTGPATPTGLRASAGDGYIEWTWDAVADVLGYQGQFSTDATFTDADTTFLIAAPKTSHRVHNQASGYFRVRSGTGTSLTDLASLQFSDWTDPVSGTTTVAPTPTPTPTTTPISVPGNVRTSTRQNTAITVAWDGVSDAEAYEVQQQAAGAGSWSSASCGGAGNQVTVTECVASGLDRGTAYGFRVRAVPDSADTDLAPSAWSSAVSATTTGRPAVTLEDGGLNLRWKSELDTRFEPPTHAITWLWDPVEDRALQPLVDHYVALLNPEDANTENDACPSLDRAPVTTEELTDASLFWVNLDSDISVTLRPVGPTAGADNTGTTPDENRGDPGEVRGLCVVRTWEDERGIRQFGDVSLVWGSTLPAAADADDDGTLDPPSIRQNAVTRATTSVGWSYEIDAGFTYVLSLLSTSRDNDAPSDPTECGGGDPVNSPRAVNNYDFVVSYRDSSPDPYTHYRLCIRAENDYGASEWWFVGTSTTRVAPDVETRPAAACVPQYSASESGVTTEEYGGQEVSRIVWSCANKDGIPLDGDSYYQRVLRTTTSSVRSGEVQDTCETGTGVIVGTNSSAALFSLSATNTNSGFEIDLNDGDLTATPVIVNDSLVPDEYYIYACVRADPTPDSPGTPAPGTLGDDNHGPWSISSPQRFVAGRPTAPTGNAASNGNVGDGEITWSWTAPALRAGEPAPAGYQVQYRIGTAAVVGESDPTATVNGTTLTYTRSVTAGTAAAARVRSYVSIGGRRLYSAWSAIAAETAQ